MKDEDELQLQTTTVSQARVQLYQPTRRPIYCVRTVQTAWGEGTVKGKLGQGHADFVEAVLFHSRKIEHLEGGSFRVRVDPYHVRVSMGGGKKASYAQMWSVATDVQSAVVRLSITVEKDAPPLRIQGGIIDLIAESSTRVVDPATRAPGRTTRVSDRPTRVLDRGGSRPLWVVTFNAAFAHLLWNDHRLDYDPEPFARLETGIAQALARHVYTHKNQPGGGWKLDSLIEVVGAGGSALRDRRREVRRDAERLKALGIDVRDDRVFRVSRGANAPGRGLDAPSRGANAPGVEQTPHRGRSIQALQA